MVTPPGPPVRRRVSSMTVIVCMTVVIIGLLVACVLLAETHHDATPLITILVAVLGAGIPGVAALNKTAEVGNQVQVVQHQTNGNMSRLLDLAEQVVTAQISSAVTAHATAQQAITAVTAAAESPSVPAAVQTTPVPRDAPPPPSAGGLPGSQQ